MMIIIIPRSLWLISAILKNICDAHEDTIPGSCYNPPKFVTT
jgi:uncharacterized protein with PQ loop repeat